MHKDVHWCLAIINMKENTFQYLDSLGGTDHNVLNMLVSICDVSRMKVDLKKKLNSSVCSLFFSCFFLEELLTRQLFTPFL